MEEEKLRNRAEIWGLMPLFPMDTKGRPKKFSKEEVGKLYDMLEENYDERKSSEKNEED